MPKQVTYKSLEGYIQSFTQDKKPKGIIISDPDFAYYHKRALLYFDLKSRLESETDYSLRNSMSYKISVIYNDFEELHRKAQYHPV